jgi:hypothetical protein
MKKIFALTVMIISMTTILAGSPLTAEAWSLIKPFSRVNVIQRYNAYPNERSAAIQRSANDFYSSMAGFCGDMMGKSYGSDRFEDNPDRNGYSAPGRKWDYDNDGYTGGFGCH